KPSPYCVGHLAVAITRSVMSTLGAPAPLPTEVPVASTLAMDSYTRSCINHEAVEEPSPARERLHDNGKFRRAIRQPAPDKRWNQGDVHGPAVFIAGRRQTMRSSRREEEGVEISRLC